MRFIEMYTVLNDVIPLFLLWKSSLRMVNKSVFVWVFKESSTKTCNILYSSKCTIDQFLCNPQPWFYVYKMYNCFSKVVLAGEKDTKQAPSREKDVWISYHRHVEFPLKIFILYNCMYALIIVWYF